MNRFSFSILRLVRSWKIYRPLPPIAGSSRALRKNPHGRQTGDYNTKRVQVLIVVTTISYYRPPEQSYK
jgi:hypothetical protein